MNTYKITVLSDLDKNASKTLKSAVGLAKIIGGTIEVFTVKNASEIVKGDNQLSAMRTINSKTTSFRKKMKELIDPIAEQYEVKISASFSMGNIKGEIGHYIDVNKPDIIVMGKRKGKMLNIIGDRLTAFVLNKFKGAILIANHNGVIEPNQEIAMGMLNNLGSEFNLEFAEDLMENTQSPLTSFKIGHNSEIANTVTETYGKKTVEYVFENGDGAVQGISKHLVQNKIDVLYLDRFKTQADKKIKSGKSDIKNVIDKLNVSLLVSGDENYNLN